MSKLVRNETLRGGPNLFQTTKKKNIGGRYADLLKKNAKLHSGLQNHKIMGVEPEGDEGKVCTPTIQHGGE